jgi:hypothetical protein
VPILVLSLCTDGAFLIVSVRPDAAAEVEPDAAFGMGEETSTLAKGSEARGRGVHGAEGTGVETVCEKCPATLVDVSGMLLLPSTSSALAAVGLAVDIPPVRGEGAADGVAFGRDGSSSIT